VRARVAEDNLLLLLLGVQDVEDPVALLDHVSVLVVEKEAVPMLPAPNATELSGRRSARRQPIEAAASASRA